MPWIPEEEIKRAREITAIEYLKKYQPNRLKKSSARNEWELTDHDSFYEHYGWEFYCMATGDGEETPSRMYVHKNTDKH